MTETDDTAIISTDAAEGLIAQAATLHPIEYERQRKAIASECGLTVGALDKFVKQKQGANDEENDSTNELLDGIESWPHEVDGEALAFEIKRLFNRHCALPPFADVALTLWAIATYTINEHRIFPKLSVVSPTPRCGKTTTLEVLSAVCNKSLSASNLTSAVMFRLIDECQPSLLVDECDTFFAANNELNGIINCGHTKSGAVVWRVEGDAGNRRPVMFSTWTPMALFRIGTFSATIQDRSVTVPLKRKLAGETVERLPVDIGAQNIDLRRKCLRWHNDSQADIVAIEPNVPNLDNDRAEDNWRALITVAEVIGGEWPELARTAAKVLTEVETSDDDFVLGLLHDIKKIATERGWKKTIFSKDVCTELNELSDRPWPSMRGDKGISQYTLAKFLKPFELKPSTRRDGHFVAKGYSLTKFNEAFSRYCSNNPPKSVTTLQPAVEQPISDFQSVTSVESVTDLETLRAFNNAGCNGVTDLEGENTGKEEITKAVTL